MRSIQTNTMIFMSDRLSIAFSFSRRAHLLTTPKGRWYCQRLHRMQPCALRGGCGSCGSLMDNATSRQCCCHCPRSYCKHTRFCVCEQGYKLYPTLLQLPVKNIRLMFFTAMGIASPATPIFFFAKKKQKQERKDGENQWRSTTWKPRWSAEARDGLRLPLPLI